MHTITWETFTEIKLFFSLSGHHFFDSKWWLQRFWSSQTTGTVTTCDTTPIFWFLTRLYWLCMSLQKPGYYEPKVEDGQYVFNIQEILRPA